MRALTLILLSTLSCSRKAQTPVAPPVVPAPALLSKADARAHPEGYSLRLHADGTATIDASTDAGRFYAQQTLKQLKPPPKGAIEIHDAPRYRWRGLHFDVARHFFPAGDIEHVLDLMARLKLNVFHWHLTDDQGWRLPIPKRPGLAGPNGAYTREEIIHLVEYARARHITVVPEIEMPGHTRAAIGRYPELSCRGRPLMIPTTWGVFDDVLCAGNPDTYAFIDDVLEETAALFPGPYIHIGGDEVPTTRWDECPKCRPLGTPTVQTYFLARAAAKVRALGKRPIAWDEVLEHQAPSDLVVMAWRNVAAADQAIAAGHDTVLVPYQLTYLDRPQNPYEDDAVRTEAIAAFEPPASPRVLGVQAALWTEYVPDMKRAELQLFPRLLAVADLAWSSSDARKSNPLAARLRPALDWLEVASFVEPPAGLEPRRAFIDAGVLQLHALEGEITYDVGCTGAAQPYTRPVPIDRTTEVCARVTAHGQSSPQVRGVIVVEPPLPAIDAKPGPPGVRWAYFEDRFEALPDFDRLGEPQREGAGATLVPDYVRKHDWALRAEGLFEAPVTKVYRFTLTSDDGSRLTIDGRGVIENDGLHAPRQRSGEIALEKGLHRARVEFFQQRGGFKLELSPFELRQ